MRSRLFVLIPVLSVTLSAAACAAAPASQPLAPSRQPALPRTTETFANPLDVLVADPFIFREGDTYYLYGTAARSGLLVWTSKNLVDWQLHDYAFRRSTDSWSRGFFWAPELFKHKGKYYLHFTAVGGENQARRIVLAESDSPLGPFKEVKAPWFEPGQSTIDSHVFRDDDGQLYLYAVYTGEKFDKRFQITVRKVDEDLNPAGHETVCISPSLKWEGDYVNEGPFILKHDGVYFLTYSGNGYHSPDYCVGVATSKSPLGPWTKQEHGPILHRGWGVSGPGHHCFIDSPDHKELFIVYHTHQFVEHPGPPRQLAIDRARFVMSPKPTIEVGVATTQPIPMPSGSRPHVRGQNDEFDSPKLDRDRWTVFSEGYRRDPHWLLADGALKIQTEDGDVHEDRSDLSNLFLQYAPVGDFTVTTRVNISPDADYQQAFLTLWQDHNNYAKLVYLHSHGGRKIEVGVERQEHYDSHLHDAANLGNEVFLRIRRTGTRCDFLISTDGRRWQSIESQNVPLTDLRVGLGACSPGGAPSTTAAFDFIRFEK
jgi:beta-xylosidase